MIKITAIVENETPDTLTAEHGLALLIETENRRILMDTGAGRALLPNAEKLHLDLTGLDLVFLSHGHYDHTGGLAALAPAAPVYGGPGITAPCFSRQKDGSMHNITMPADSMMFLKKADFHTVDKFQEIRPGIFSTGPIARDVPPDNGKVFYSNPEGTAVNPIPEEQSLLLQEGILITGCCHAGIINTIETCRKNHPEIPLKVFMGGMHLLYAGPEQLQRICSYLNSLHLEKLLLLHCTGTDAKAYLKNHLSCQVLIGRCGDSWLF